LRYCVKKIKLSKNLHKIRLFCLQWLPVAAAGPENMCCYLVLEPSMHLQHEKLIRRVS